MSFFEYPSWMDLLLDGVFRTWWFDPVVASVSFGGFVNWYWNHERKRGLSSDTTFTQSMGWGPLFDSLAAYWIGICIFMRVVPPPAPTLPDGIPNNVSEVLYLVAEVVSGIVLYDAGMFFLHLAMHEFQMLKSWHAKHHDQGAGTVEARDTLRHSLLDGSLQVIVNIGVQRFTFWGAVKSRLARCLHTILVTWMLAESHTASPEPNSWRNWFVGVREHRLHHLGKHNRHEQFFGYLDDARAWWQERQRIKETLE
jgi:sterol desaturase/sphingolipid hydroxylase (fatty acid hydroxylase superfamily)